MSTAQPPTGTMPLSADHWVERAIETHPEPWTDEAILKRLHCERELTAPTIAREHFDGECCASTVRNRLKAFGIYRPSSVADQLEAMNPDKLGLSKLGDR